MQYKLINVEQGTALIKNLWPKMKTALESGKTLLLNVEEELHPMKNNHWSYLLSVSGRFSIGKSAYWFR